MTAISMQTRIKIIGSNGQLSLGKRFAGRPVLMEEQEPGVWLLRIASIVPDNEQWLHESQSAVDMQNALTWAQAHPPSDVNIDAALETLRG